MADTRRPNPPESDHPTDFEEGPDTLAEIRECLSEVLHDLHTPLAALSLLALPEPVEGSPEDDSRRQLRRAVTALRRQTQILRDHPLFRSQPLRLSVARVDLASWLAELRPLLEELAEARGVGLDWNTPEIPCAINLDPSRMAAAVEHLFLHRARGAVRPGRLRLDVTLGDGLLRLSIGAIEAILADPYAQHQRTSAGVEFAQSVVDAHGGRLAETSRADGWREWTLELPQDSVLDVGSGADSQPDQDSLIKVIVVEDDAALRELLSDLLSIRFPVVACRDAAEALASVRDEEPDLMVIDHGLPDATGLELAVRIREITGRRIPLLLVTGSTPVEGFEKLEAMSVLVKPFRGTDLLARSTDLLRLGED
jgi:CheY-like chemotaxis protein